MGAALAFSVGLAVTATAANVAAACVTLLFLGFAACPTR